jgi:DNA repair exonuclease SbcCD ATPase subunit
MVNIPKWVQEFLAPQLNELKGKIEAIDTKIESFKSESNTRFESLNMKIDEVEKRLSIRIEEMDKRLTDSDRHLSDKMGSIDQKLSSKIDDLAKLVDVSQRLAVLEAKQREFEKRSGTA